VLDPSPSTLRARARRTGSFLSLPELRWALVSAAAFASAVVVHLLGGPGWLESTLLALCLVSGGWEPALAGLEALRERSLDVDLLMIVAALVAVVIGEAFDGALLIVIFATSGALESVATKRTRDSVRSLLDLAPEQASRILADGTEEVVDAAALTPGEIILVRPGERVACDGHVVTGASEIDESSVTGEPLPVPKHPGDAVLAGTVNGTGAIEVHVDAAAADSVVARIVALVEEASATKADTQLFIERVEQRYSIGIVVATLALVAVPLVLGAELQPTLLRAMTFMIVASPCALVLATMPPLLSAIANAGRHGVLVKSAVVMEQVGHTDVVAFDKTGTLTEGRPVLVAVHPRQDAGLDADVVLSLAAGCERHSEHPLAEAILVAASRRGVAVPAATEFRAVPGIGVTAVVDGRRIAVEAPGSSTSGIVEAVHAAGSTAVVVSSDGAPIGVLELDDHARPAARAAVARLRALTGTTPVLLTGDNPGAGARLAQEVGIDVVHAELLPHDKVDVVRALGEHHHHVSVVGDGVNDAPALAAAGTGIAMGRTGSDLALETADVVVVRDELDTVPAVIDLSRRTRRIVAQNLAFAGSMIVVLVAIDFAGHLPLPLGVLGHEGSTVVVGLNGLRLLRNRAWTAPPV
jgi:heavy metal translocating P-type ATPase